MQCARSVRVRKSRPVSQFCHTLFTTDIISYIQVTFTHVQMLQNHPFKIRLCFPLCFHFLVLLLHNAAQSSSRESFRKACPTESRNIWFQDSWSTCRLSGPTPPSLPTAFMCIIMLIPHWPCWLFFLFLSPLLLWKGFKCNGLFAASSLDSSVSSCCCKIFIFFLIPYSAPFHKISTCPLCPLCCDCYGAEEEGECPGHRYKTSFETDLFFPACW